MNQPTLDIIRRVLNLEAEALNRIGQRIDGSYDEAISLLLPCQGRVVVTGMGKSGLIARKIAATLSSTGTRSLFIHPAEAYHGDLGMIGPDDVVIAISYSGETEEILRILPFLDDNSIKSIAITGHPQSSLARYTTLHLDAHVDREACPLQLAPTASTTAALAVGDALAVCLMELRGFRSEDFARYHPGGSIGKRLLARVKDVMRTTDFPFVSRSADFKDVINAVSSARLGFTAVGDPLKLAGVITDGDLRRVMDTSGPESFNLAAHEFMTRDPITVTPDTRLAEAVQIMESHNITVLVVMEENKVVGMLHLFECGL